MTAPRINVTLRLAREDIEAVDRLAKQDDRSRSQMLRLLVAEAVAGRSYEPEIARLPDWETRELLRRTLGERDEARAEVGRLRANVKDEE